MDSASMNRQGCKMDLAINILKISQLLGIWPKENWNFIFCIKLICIWSFCHIIIAGLIFYIIYYVSNYGFNFSNLADAIMGLCAISIGTYFVIIMAIRRTQLIKLLKDVGDFTVYEIPKGIEILNDRINLLVEVFALWMLSSTTISIAYSMTSVCEDNTIDDCGLLIIGYFPFVNIYKYPYRQIFVVLQGQNALHLIAMTLFPACVMLVIPLFIVNRINHLKDMLREIPDMQIKDRKKHVKKCVLYHYKIIEFADRLHAIAFEFMIVHVSGTTFVVTLIIYQLLHVFKYINFAHGLVWFIYLYVICLIGELLYQSSVELADVIYESIPWDGDIETQKALLLMMIRAQKPISIPGGMSDRCCHELLANAMKTSYSTIAMLLEVS